MKRFLLLLLIVLVIVAGIAWITGEPTRTQAAPIRSGPGEIAATGAGTVVAGLPVPTQPRYM